MKLIIIKKSKFSVVSVLTNDDQTLCENKWSIDSWLNELFIVVFWSLLSNVATNDDWIEFVKNQKNLSQSEKKWKNDSSFQNNKIWMNVEMDSKELSTEWRNLNAKDFELKMEFKKNL